MDTSLFNTSTLDVTRLVTVGLIVAGTLVAMQVASRLLRRSMAAHEAVPTTSIFINVVRGVILVLGFLAILAVFDISITPILTALGVGGLAVALALQDTLSNLFAGLQIVATRQIRPGDYVLLQTGQEGTVTDIAWRTTTLRAPSESLVIVPNSVLGQAIVTNFQSQLTALPAGVEFSVPLGSDLSLVERVAAEVAAAVMRDAAPEGVELPEPSVRFKAFGEASVVCAAVLFAPLYGDQVPFRSAFIKALHERFAAEGLAFAVPKRVVETLRSY